MVICGIFFNDPLEELVYIYCLVATIATLVVLIFGLKDFVKSCVEDHCWWMSLAKALLVIIAIALWPITLVVAFIVYIVKQIIKGVKEAKQELKTNNQ